MLFRSGATGSTGSTGATGATGHTGNTGSTGPKLDFDYTPNYVNYLYPLGPNPSSNTNINFIKVQNSGNLITYNSTTKTFTLASGHAYWISYDFVGTPPQGEDGFFEITPFMNQPIMNPNNPTTSVVYVPGTIVATCSSNDFITGQTAKISGCSSYIIPSASVPINLYLNYSSDFEKSYQLTGTIAIYAIPIQSDFIQD